MFLILAVPVAAFVVAYRPQPQNLRAITKDADDALISTSSSVASALRDLWTAATTSETTELSFPACEALRDPRTWAALFEHLECCKDVCDYFVAVPSLTRTPDSWTPKAVLRRVQQRFEEEEDDDDDWELSPELLAKLGEIEEAPTATWEDKDDAEILSTSKRWVDAIVSGAGVCPFSVNADKAGLPVGAVRYAVSRAADAEALYAAYWEEVEQIESKNHATTLLVLADQRWSYNLEEFETFGTTLAQALDAEGLGFESQLQLVFFHPSYVFRDGRERAGSEGAANFARRSPYPMVNILRTPQVRNAQRGLPTGLVYAQNEATLKEFGTELLGEMLQNRDWSPIAGRKVDRSQIEVLRIASDLMKEQSNEAE